MSAPKLEIEVRETDRRDETPDLRELVFRTVYSPNHSASNVERLTVPELRELQRVLNEYLP